MITIKGTLDFSRRKIIVFVLIVKKLMRYEKPASF